MKIMKNIIYAIVAVAAAFSLYGCVENLQEGFTEEDMRINIGAKVNTSVLVTKSGTNLDYNTDTTDSPEYIRILTRKIPELRNMFDTFMSESNYDAVFFTTMRCPPSVIYDKQDPTYKCSIPDPYTPSYIASALGLPEISVPAGSDQHNLPIGVSFLGKYGEDSEILNLAHAIEKIQH